MSKTLSLFLFTLVLVATRSILAAPPLQMSNQGRLASSSGEPLSGPHDLTFSIYDDLTSELVWTETLVGVDFNDGYYSVVLGLETPIDMSMLDGISMSLGMSLDGAAEFDPRMPITSVPFAIVAGSVAGGVVDASEIRLNGSTILSSSSADDALTQIVGVACTDADQVLKWHVEACDTPPCAAGWECGTITSQAGGDMEGVLTRPEGGLVGGADTGTVSLALKPCTTGTSLVFTGGPLDRGKWECGRVLTLSDRGGDAAAPGDLSVAGATSLTGNVSMAGNLAVAGTTSFARPLDITTVTNKHLTLSSTGIFMESQGAPAPLILNNGSEVIIGGQNETSLTVSGATSLHSVQATSVSVSGSTALQAASATSLTATTLGVSGAATLQSASATNLAASTLEVSGSTTLHGTTMSGLSVSGVASVTGTMSLHEYVNFDDDGAGPDAASSDGYKLALYGAPTSANYSIGVESGNIWFNSSGGFNFYNGARVGGTDKSPIMSLSDSGKLSVANLSVNDFTLGTSTTPHLQFTTTGITAYANASTRDDLTLDGSTVNIAPNGSLVWIGDGTGDTDLRVTGNTILEQYADFADSAAAPDADGNSAGYKLALFNGPSSNNYSLGVESGHMWFTSDGGYKWYRDANTATGNVGTPVMRIDEATGALSFAKSTITQRGPFGSSYGEPGTIIAAGATGFAKAECDEVGDVAVSGGCNCDVGGDGSYASIYVSKTWNVTDAGTPVRGTHLCRVRNMGSTPIECVASVNCVKKP